MREWVPNATICRRDDLNDYLSVIRVCPDGGRIPDFEPGQFITLGLLLEEAQPSGPASPARTRSVRRPYSIASSNQGVDYLEFLIILVERGRLTTRLWQVEEGGRVWLDQRVHGDFTLRGVPSDTDLVMVATGTGIAPFMSMLRRYRGTGRWRRFVLIHGVRQVQDLAYRAELEAVAASDPSVIYVPLVSRADSEAGWAGLRGRVPLALRDDVYQQLVGAPLHPDHCHVYLCGNPQMIEDVERLLVARGFVPQTRHTPGNLHYERYW